MTQGILNWNKSIRYEQTKNAFEETKRKILLEKVREGKLLPEDVKFLESCGAEAFACLMEGLGYFIPDAILLFPTGAALRVPDAVMAWLNSPARGKYLYDMDNRYADVYVDIARECFGCPAYLHQYTIFDDVMDFLWSGHGVQFCLKDPGHWEAGAAADRGTDEIIYYDSWGGRNVGIPALKNGGNQEHLARMDWYNVQPTVVVYPRKL